ncbi:MAG TPA: hypothetical protein VGG29_06735 [Caulobacteraceae bacterium]|jgi:hypothetical protein
MARRVNIMLTVRALHSYIGAFVAPLVLFLTFTGSLQVFSLHEAHGGYTPPALLVRLSRVHKDQVIALPKARPQSDAAPRRQREHAAAPAPHKAAPHKAAPWAVTALKWLFVAVAAGLALSTLLGLWMAFTFGRRKRLILALLIAGAALPILLVALQG